MEQKTYTKVYVQWRDSGFSLLADNKLSRLYEFKEGVSCDEHNN